jgi:thiol:disulfide interchange protein
MLEKKGFDEFGKFYDEFHKEDAKLELNFKEGKLKEHKWSDLQQKEVEYFKQYKEYLESREVKKPVVQQKMGKKMVEYKGTASGLNPIEYLEAKRDYQLRKAAKQV